MPHAAAIPAVSISPASASALAAKTGPSGKASGEQTPGGVFGALFREQAGAADAAVTEKPAAAARTPISGASVAGTKQGATDESGIDESGIDGSGITVPAAAADGSVAGSPADALKLKLNSTAVALPGSMRPEGPSESANPDVEMAKAVDSQSPVLKSGPGIYGPGVGAEVADGSAVGAAATAAISARSDSKAASSASAQADRASHKGKETSREVQQNAAGALAQFMPAQGPAIVGAPAAAPGVASGVTLGVMPAGASTGGASKQASAASISPRADMTAVASSQTAPQVSETGVAQAGDKTAVAAPQPGGTDGGAIEGHDSADAGTGVAMVSDFASGALHPGHVAAVHEGSTVAAGSAAAAPAAVGAPLEAHFDTRTAGTEAATALHAAQAAPAAVSQPVGAGAASASAASPFDRIDQGASPVVLHSGAQSVQVGVHDQQLGWVEISAQNNAGHVDATLVAASGHTHSELAAQLPAIAQYMRERDVQVGMLAVHHPAAQTGAHGGSSSGQSGGGQPGGSFSGSSAGSGGGGAQGFHRPDSGSAASDVRPARMPGVSSSDSVSSAVEGSSLRPVSYISVRA